MLVAIPSKGRPASVKSQRVIPVATVFVPENEVDSYAKAGVKNIVPVPVDILGITKTRNWILDNTDEPRVVFIDDDVKRHGWLEVLETRMKHHELTEREWINQFVKLFDVCEQTGARIWGVSTESSPRSWYPTNPLRFRSYITASCMGILNGKIRFDEEFVVKEDYEMVLRAIQEDGFVIAARYLFWENSHWKDNGGVRDYRTQEIEKKCITMLKQKYPGLIRSIKRKDTNYQIILDF